MQDLKQKLSDNNQGLPVLLNAAYTTEHEVDVGAYITKHEIHVGLGGIYVDGFYHTFVGIYNKHWHLINSVIGPIGQFNAGTLLGNTNIIAVGWYERITNNIPNGKVAVVVKFNDNLEEMASFISRIMCDSHFFNIVSNSDGTFTCMGSQYLDDQVWMVTGDRVADPTISVIVDSNLNLI